jgi:hypothetical protein
MSVWSFLFIVNLTVHSATICIDTDNKSPCFIRNFYNLVFPVVYSNDKQKQREYIESLDAYFRADPIKCLNLVRKHWDYNFKYLFWERNYPILLACYLDSKLNYNLRMMSDIFGRISEEIQRRYLYMRLNDKESQSVNFKCIEIMISMVKSIKIEILKMREHDEKYREDLLFKIDESIKIWEFIKINLSFDSEGGVDYHSFFESFEKIRRCIIRKQDLCTETRSLCILFLIYSSIVRFSKCRKLFDFEDSERKSLVVYMALRIYPAYCGILDVAFFIYKNFKKVLLENTEGKLGIFKRELEGPFQRYLIKKKCKEIHLRRPFSYLFNFIDSLENDEAWELLASLELERFIFVKSKTPIH